MDAVSEIEFVKIFAGVLKLLPSQQILNCLIPEIDIVWI